MYVLRVLNGPLTGKIFPLKKGKNLVGRAAHCDVQLVVAGISKEHAEVQLLGEKIIVSDLQSSNGTYINGVKVQNAIVRMGEKLSFHDMVVDFVMSQKQTPEPTSQAKVAQNYPQHYPQNFPQHYPQPYQHGGMPPLQFQGYQSANAMDMNAQANVQYQQNKFTQAKPEPLAQLKTKIQLYLDQKALPGLYSLPQFLEYKMVVLSLVSIFVFILTLASLFPTLKMSEDAIRTESFRRAQSLARMLAQANQEVILSRRGTMLGSTIALSTMSVETEPGVKESYLIQHVDGSILAPAAKAGQVPTLGFIHQARNLEKPFVASMSGDKIFASYPITAYDAQTNTWSPQAHAVIIYDVSSHSVGSDRIISLFIQNLILSTFIGFIFYFFLMKLIEYPMSFLDKQLDQSLRDNTDNIKINFQYPLFQNLISNLNSLLSRYIAGDRKDEAPQNYTSSQQEIELLIQFFPQAAAALSSEGKILGANDAFGNLARLSPIQLQGQPLQAIQDSAFQQNVTELLARAKMKPTMTYSDPLEFSGVSYRISLQAFNFQALSAQFYLVVVSLQEGHV
ncbi:MAG: FHA domain-containing protein [Pseudobdellovibrionaceae bacterium]